MEIEPVMPNTLPDEFFVRMDGQLRRIEQLQTEADWKAISALVQNKLVRVRPD